MSRRRAVLALSVFSLVASSIIGVVTPVRAQTGVEQASDRVEEAASDVDDAYKIVDEAVAERDAVEDQLFEVLDRYSVNAERLTELAESLERLDESLVLAESEAIATRDLFEVQAVTAYIQAVSTDGTVIFDSGNVERAMVAGETLRRSSQETMSTLDRYLAFTQELESLRQEVASQRTATEEVRAQLSSDAEALEGLFAVANADVASAFEAAQDAEARLAEAEDRARAAELAAARQTTTTTATATTTTSAPSTSRPTSTTSTTGPTSTTSTSTTPTTATTTTTQPPGDWPPIPISSAVLAWRPLLEQHFAPDLVLDSMVIMQCESRGDPEALNPHSGASGLFQFMPGTWAVASVEAGVGDRSVFEGEANIIAASWLAEYYRSRGYDPWRPWVCRKFL